MSHIQQTLQRMLHAIVLLTVLVIMLGGIVTLLQRLDDHAQAEQRRVSYAATATHMALPTGITPPTQVPPATPLPTTPPSSPEYLPTQQDFAILPTPTLDITLPPGVPTRMPILSQHYSYELVNFLVLGSDQRGPTTAYRTDVIMIVSVNWTTGTVNLLSIPRDLYVYVPGWGMDRINTAELHQTQTGTTHHRLGLLAETVEYNLGIRIDHIARIDFSGFEQLIDLLGGVTVPVDCPVSGYQPAASGTGWVPFTLEPGVYNLNGDMALWYVRQRIDSSDFDRNRRQQIVLRALWRKVAASDLVALLPQMWDTVSQTIQTDLSLDQAMAYIPIFLGLDSSKLESHFLGLDEVNLWRTPNGASVLVIDELPMRRTLEHFITPPVENQLHSERAIVEVINASSIANADQLAAAQLDWAGLLAFPAGFNGAVTPRTLLYDYSGQLKGSSAGTVQALFRLIDDDVIVTGTESRSADFTLIVGDDYVSCTTSPWKAFAQPE